MAEEKSEQVQDSDVSSAEESKIEEAAVAESQEEIVEDTSQDDELDKRIQRANKEAAKFRVEKKEVETKYNDLIDNLGKALGFVEESEGSNAESLAEEVAKLQSENKNLKLMQAFNNVVSAEGADEELTWSYLMAMGGLTDLDADDPELKDKLGEMITKAVEAKPNLKANASPSVAKKSGIDMSNDNQPLDTESRIRQLEADKNLKEARKLKSQRLYELARENN